MTHTPGPWRIGRSGSDTLGVYPQDRRHHNPICFLGMGMDEEQEDFPNAEPNARLIAAAPALLEALENAVKSFDMDGPNAAAAAINSVGRAAIALAKGEDK